MYSRLISVMNSIKRYQHNTEKLTVFVLYFRKIDRCDNIVYGSKSMSIPSSFKYYTRRNF